MSKQKKTIKVLMFLLPAVVSLLAYTAFHEMLFRKPPCLINCDQPGMFSDNEKIKKWLAYLESLRDDTFDTKSSNKRTFPTPLDIAFLQDKINLASNQRDYLTRYQQIISDLTSPNVVKDESTEAKGSVELTDKVSQLAYLAEDKDPNNQVFANTPIDGTDSGATPFSDPRTSPYYVPSGNGPAFFAGGNPNDNGGSAGGGESNGNPNNNGNPNGGTPGGPVIPTGPGGNNNPTPGGGNPISTVPVPSSDYLIFGVALVIGLVRLKITGRANFLGFK